MNINSISHIPFIRQQVTRNIAFKAGKIEDTFERTTKPVAKTDNKAIQWLENNDFINKNLISTLSNPENKIGSGFTHTGYKIPGNDEYILRVANSDIPSDKFASYEIKDTEDKNLKINIGQSVAEIELKDASGKKISDIEVLKKQTGEPLGVKPFSTIYNEDGTIRKGELPFNAPERKADYEKSLEAVANLPVEAFETFLDNIKEASDNGYYFDYLNSNNVLVDKENNSLNLIDMEYRGRCSGYDYGSVLYTLTNSEYFDTYTSRLDDNPKSSEEMQKAVDNAYTIIDKYTTAMKNKGLKFDREKYTPQAQQMMLTFPFAKFCQTFDFNEEWNILKEKGLA